MPESNVSDSPVTTAPPAPTPVAVTVTAPEVPKPVIDGYTQFILTIIALLLTVITFILVMGFSKSFRAFQDLPLFGPNGPRFDNAPLTPAVKDELQKLVLPWRFMPIGKIFLTTSPDKSGKDGQSFIWGTVRVNRWKDAGFVIVKDQQELAKIGSLSAADRKRLSDAGVEAVATIEATWKGNQYVCNAERGKALGWPCLEVKLGDFDQLQIARTEWGKRGIYYFRLVLATFDISPSPEMQALYKGDHFWRYECAAVLQHDPFRDTWRVAAFNAGQMDDAGLDTSEIMKLWSTMESHKDN